MKRQLITAMLFVGAGGGLTGTASAQDALGRGDVLDANLSTQGTRNQASGRIDFRSRNLLVTGDVAGGRGFRGSVGYTSEYDFRDSSATVGSNDFYRFRADSAYSNLATKGLGSTYNQIRYGQELGALEYRRATSADPVSQYSSRGQSEYRSSYVLDDAARLDRLSTETTFSQRSERYVDSEVIGAGQTEAGDQMFIASDPMRGVHFLESDDPRFSHGLTTYDMMRLEEDRRMGYEPPQIGVEFDTDFESRADSPTFLMPDQSDTTTPSSRVDSQVEARTTESASDYDRILENIISRYAERDDADVNVDEGLLKSVERDYSELVEEIRERQRQAEDGDADDDGRNALPEDPRRRLDREDDEDEADDEDRSVLDGLSTAQRQRMLDALRHERRVESLTTAETNRFNELVRQASDALSRGEYFTAERRFVRALRFNPGEPLASAGLGHAQLGAGTLATASLTLRQLLSNNPEMIDVLYEPALLPERAMLLRRLTELGERLDSELDLVGNGFLMAYIGHQLNDRPAIRRGLDAMNAGDPGATLQRVLRPIWLDGDQPVK